MCLQRVRCRGATVQLYCCEANKLGRVVTIIKTTDLADFWIHYQVYITYEILTGDRGVGSGTQGTASPALRGGVIA